MIQVTFLRDFCATQNGDGYDAGEIATLSDDFANQLIAYRIAKPLTQPAPLKPYEVGCSNKWDFNVGLNDLKGTNNLTNYGATQNTGYYTFDGTDDYMTGSGPVSLSTAFSIEFIANISATQMSIPLPPFLFGDYDDTHGRYWAIRIESNALYILEITTGAPSTFTTPTIPNTATHFGITSDGATVRLYVNGVNTYSSSVNMLSVAPLTAFTIGAYLGNISETATACDLYLTRIFANTALTSGQVLNNYNAESWRI
jgi:hypothetical protein